MNEGPFDYIIVGAGSAGCVLANRLTEDPKINVLLLEAGGSDAHPMISIPKGIAFTLSNPKYAWFYRTEPFGPVGQVEYWARGKVLGGSSSVNGMVYNRGSQADYDGLEALGNPGWGWNEMLRVFKSMEDHSLGASDMRGTGGPLQVDVRKDSETVGETLMKSAGGLGIETVQDLNASDGERIGYAPATIRNGMRVSAAKAFLRPALKRPNLTLRTNASVSGLIFDGETVTGVTASAGESTVTFSAKREVILSMGSIATPQLLELSGIGRRDVLTAAGIDVRVESENIGEGVREHRCLPLQVRLNKNIGYNRKLSSPPRQGLSGLEWMLTRKGPISTPAYDMLTFFKTAPELERPDAQVLLTPYSSGAGSTGSNIENRPGFSLLGFTLRPTSKGSVHVTSKDPRATPRIIPNYLSTEHDRSTSIALFRKMRALVKESPIAEFASAETVPGHAVEDDDSIIRSAFLNGGTGYHACGAVAMGPNETDAVDSRLRVRGVRNLRVVDVSVMPAMISGNLNGPAMAMAWRAAELIREGRLNTQLKSPERGKQMTTTQDNYVANASGPLDGERRLFIDGQLVDASDGGLFENIDPSTGESAGYAANATEKDMERAIAGARRAFDEGVWASDPEFRSRCILQLRDALEEEKERLRRIVVTESGSPIALTYGVQLQQPLDEPAYWAEMARGFAYEEEWTPTTSRGAVSRRRIRYEPMGVVAAITPWNYPLYLNVSESIPALAAGNAVILKPASLTPWSGLELGRLVAERTDIPAGIFNVVTTNTVAVTEMLTSDPRIDMVTFTGSTSTGRRVLASGAPTIKKTFLELGGKSAHIVLDDADFNKVLPGAAVVCAHAGQGCTYSTRLLIPRSRYDEALPILKAVFEKVPVGDVWDPSVIQGPQASAKQRDAILAAIESGVASGARLLTGGHAIEGRAGYYVQPTVLVDVVPSSDVAQEEIFGPVLCVIPYDTEDEAVTIANSTIYGLAGEVSSASDERALEVARRLRAGNISVNGGAYFDVSTPLGGYGQSGIGRRNGEEGFREYMELKSIGIPDRG